MNLAEEPFEKTRFWPYTPFTSKNAFQFLIKTENYSGNTKMRKQDTRQELWYTPLQNVDWQYHKNNWNILIDMSEDLIIK